MTDDINVNPPELFQPDPRKLPPWYFTGIILCTKTREYETVLGTKRMINDGSVRQLRERWDNAETGEIEMRVPSTLDITDEQGQ